MTDLKISQLGAATALGGTELIAGVQGGGSVRITPAQLRAYTLKVATGDPTAANDSGQGHAVGSAWFNSMTGVGWRCLDASAGAALWAPMGDLHPGYVSGFYYPAAHNAVSQTQAVAADTLYACPIYVARRVALSGLGIRLVAGVAGTAVKLGLYANGAGRPGARLAADNVGVATISGSPTDISFTFSANLAIGPGWYWIAALFNGAPTPATIAGTDTAASALLGNATMLSTSVASSRATGVTGTATYAGGLPASFGAATVVIGNAGVPLGNIKIA